MVEAQSDVAPSLSEIGWRMTAEYGVLGLAPSHLLTQVARAIWFAPCDRV